MCSVRGLERGLTRVVTPNSVQRMSHVTGPHPRRIDKFLADRYNTIECLHTHLFDGPLCSGVGPGTRVEALLSDGKVPHKPMVSNRTDPLARQVTVDGVVVRRSDTLVCPSQRIEYDGSRATLREPSTYALLNKSKGIVTTMGESGSEAGKAQTQSPHDADPDARGGRLGPSSTSSRPSGRAWRGRQGGSTATPPVRC